MEMIIKCGFTTTRDTFTLHTVIYTNANIEILIITAFKYISCNFDIFSPIVVQNAKWCKTGRIQLLYYVN